ncbi:MAG TPA: hypothetical protein DCG85_03290 [Lachnospiraceae bacterium]|nr:hypothetical protein [Lachnospiraceae bacterium]
MRKRSGKIKLIISLFTFALIFVLSSTCVRADMGPKPSITLTVINEGDSGNYYVALLEKRDGVLDEESKLKLDKEVNEENVEEYLKAFRYDGWCFHKTPVGGYLFEKNEDGIYDFIYMVPNPFRVVLIDQYGNVHVSKVMTKKEYNADCIYDVKTGDVSEQYEDKVAKRIVYIAVCYIFTLITEFVILLVFGYPLIKKNILSFFIVNTITNLTYSSALMSLMPGGLAILFLFFIAEIIIVIVEAIVYILTLVNKEGEHPRLRSFFYAVTANIVSAVMGVFVFFYYLWLIR